MNSTTALRRQSKFRINLRNVLLPRTPQRDSDTVPKASDATNSSGASNLHLLASPRDVLPQRTLLRSSATALKDSDVMSSSGAFLPLPLASLKDALPQRTLQRNSDIALRVSDATSSSGASLLPLLMSPRDALLLPRSVRTSVTAQTASDATSSSGASRLARTPTSLYLSEDAELTVIARPASNAMSLVSVSQDHALSRDANPTLNAVLNNTATSSTFAFKVPLSNPPDAKATPTAKVITTAMSSTSASQAPLPQSREASAKVERAASALQEKDAMNSDIASPPQLSPTANAQPTQTAELTLTVTSSTSASQVPPSKAVSAKVDRKSVV